MMRAVSISLLLAVSAHAQTGTISVVSAASYQSLVAPNSLASLFGTGLSRSTASATLDDQGNLPTELANTRVEFNGMASGLIFVSPTQINLVVPAGAPIGVNTVTVISTDTNTRRTTSAQVAASAPGLFSTDASGSGPGAILNAVTFQPAPFVTATVVNGSVTATRLAVYCTGIRGATNVTANAISPQGNRYTLVVEFAGAAPGFAGLDQINVVVPAAVDGAGAVSLTVTTEDATSNTVTFQMNLLPVNLLQLAAMTLSPATVTAGDTITATLSLTGIARIGGFPVALTTNNITAQPPGFATVPEGTASLDVPVYTLGVIRVEVGTITAQAGNVIQTANFEVDPQRAVQLASISVTPISTLGGRTLQATIGFTGTTPAGGIIVQITSDNPAARPPLTLSVPFGQSTASFQIPTVAVATPQTVTFSATFNRTTVTSVVTLRPLFTLSVDTNPVLGGMTATGSITLADPAPPGGATIALLSTDAASARVPSLLSIPAGQNFGSFTITTPVVTGSRTITISALYQGLTASLALTVSAPPPPTLSSLSISPNPITGGLSTQGTVMLQAPAPIGGIIVSLSSSALNIAQVPPVVTVPQGFTTAIFTVTTIRVPVAESATITATAGGISRSTVLTVQ